MLGPRDGPRVPFSTPNLCGRRRSSCSSLCWQRVRQKRTTRAVFPEGPQVDQRGRLWNHLPVATPTPPAPRALWTSRSRSGDRAEYPRGRVRANRRISRAHTATEEVAEDRGTALRAACSGGTASPEPQARRCRCSRWGRSWTPSWRPPPTRTTISWRSWEDESRHVEGLQETF